MSEVILDFVLSLYLFLSWTVWVQSEWSCGEEDNVLLRGQSIMRKQDVLWHLTAVSVDWTWSREPRGVSELDHTVVVWDRGWRCSVKYIIVKGQTQGEMDRGVSICGVRQWDGTVGSLLWRLCFQLLLLSADGLIKQVVLKQVKMDAEWQEPQTPDPTDFSVFGSKQKLWVFVCGAGRILQAVSSSGGGGGWGNRDREIFFLWMFSVS